MVYSPPCIHSHFIFSNGMNWIFHDDAVSELKIKMLRFFILHDEISLTSPVLVFLRVSPPFIWMCPDNNPALDEMGCVFENITGMKLMYLAWKIILCTSPLSQAACHPPLTAPLNPDWQEQFYSCLGSNTAMGFWGFISSSVNNSKNPFDMQEMKAPYCSQ